jgi:hypothetical protein
MPPRRPRIGATETELDASARAVWLMGFVVFLAGLGATLGAILLAR